jgi:hypothetical protein
MQANIIGLMTLKLLAYQFQRRQSSQPQQQPLLAQHQQHLAQQSQAMEEQLLPPEDQFLKRVHLFYRAIMLVPKEVPQRAFLHNRGLVYHHKHSISMPVMP